MGGEDDGKGSEAGHDAGRAATGKSPEALKAEEKAFLKEERERELPSGAWPDKGEA